MRILLFTPLFIQIPLLALAGLASGALIGLFKNWKKAVAKDGPLSNLVKGVTGAGLTNAQVEQNDWNAEQAQEQRDWTERMDNTKYQRQTQDMVAAGLNPAMMYGQSVGASAPSGAAASGSSVGAPSAGLIDSIMNMVLTKQRLDNMRAEEANIKADTELKGSQIEVNTKTLDEIDAKIKQYVSTADLNETQKEQVAKITSWIDREKQAAIDLQGSQKNYYDKEVSHIESKIKNLDANTAKQWQEILNLRQEICESLHRIELIDQEAIESGTRASINVDTLDEIAARVRNYDAMTDKFTKESGLTQKELNWYWVNNGLMPGLKIAATAVGAAAGAGMFNAGGLFGPAIGRAGFRY